VESCGRRAVFLRGLNPDGGSRGNSFCFSSGLPRTLFTVAQAGGRTTSYDVAPDGRRFVMVKTLKPPRSSIVIVQNWLAAAQPGQAR